MRFLSSFRAGLFLLCCSLASFDSSGGIKKSPWFSFSRMYLIHLLWPANGTTGSALAAVRRLSGVVTSFSPSAATTAVCQCGRNLQMKKLH